MADETLSTKFCTTLNSSSAIVASSGPSRSASIMTCSEGWCTTVNDDSGKRTCTNTPPVIVAKLHQQVREMRCFGAIYLYYQLINSAISIRVQLTKSTFLADDPECTPLTIPGNSCRSRLIIDIMTLVLSSILSFVLRARSKPPDWSDSSISWDPGYLLEYFVQNAVQSANFNTSDINSINHRMNN